MGRLRNLVSGASVRAAHGSRYLQSHLISVRLTSAGESEHSGEEHRPVKRSWEASISGKKKEKKRIMLWSLFSVTPAECICTVIYTRGSCLVFALMQFKDLLTKFGVHTIENNPNSQIPSLFLWKKKKLFSMQSKMKEKFWNGICDGRAGNSSSKQNWPLKMKKIHAQRIGNLNHLPS